MKHIFHINSPIAYIAARAIIELENLPDRECYYLIERGVALQDAKNTLVLEYKYKNETSLSLWKARKKLRHLDRIIFNLVGDNKFQYYTHGLKRQVNSLIYTHKNCSSVSVFEEGSIAYRPDLLEKRTRRNTNIAAVINYICYGFREARGAEYFYDKRVYQQAYVLTDGALLGFPRRVQLSLPSVLKKLECDQCSKITNGSAIFPLSYIDRGRRNYVNAIKKALEHVLELGYKVYLKPHPSNRESVEFWDRFLGGLNEGKSVKEYEIMDQSVSLEMLAFNRKDLKFFVLDSSVGIYAQKFGCSVYSYAGLCSGGVSIWSPPGLLDLPELRPYSRCLST